MTWLHRASVLMLGLAVLLLGGLAVVLLWPTPSMTVKEPMAVFGPKVIRVGSSVELELVYCKESEDFGWVGGVLATSGVVVPLLGVWPATLPKGCHVVHIRIPIPLDTPPGNYKCYLVREHRPSALTSQGLRFESEAFDIVAATGAPK